MDEPTSTLKQFQRYVWNRLPPRRTVAGEEVVFDIVALAVTEWPSEALSQADPESLEEFNALRTLILSIKRQAEFMYGQKRFAGLWLAILQMLIPMIVQAILDWWRQRKDHRARLLMWRRKWVVDG